MKSLPCLVAVLLLLQVVSPGGAATTDASFTPPSATETDPKIEARVADLLGKLTQEEKIDLLSGTDWMHTAGVARLGIPALKFSDATAGVRCWGPSTAYPAPVLLAATWDAALASEMGRAVGRDARARGVNVVLGPGVNICREAQCGRNFEYMGEDPYLASVIAAEYIRGLQGQGVAACVKHFAVNEEETERGSMNMIVSRRALEEIYLPPFRAAIEQGGAWTAMAAYNKVNGDWCTANDFLLTEILRNQWHFQGVLMSDWGAAHDTRGDLNAGLDLEMDGRPRLFYNRSTIPPLLASGAVTQAAIDEHVRRILRLIVAMGFMDRSPTDASIPLNDPANAAIAQKVASEGIVLLRNQGSLLPLDRTKVRHLVVMGPNAENAVIGGGGSAGVMPFTKVSVLDGIRAVSGPGVQVEYFPAGNDRPVLPAQEQAAIAAADAVIYAGGLNSKLEHEGADRSWSVPPLQTAEVQQVLALNPRVILAVNAGANLGFGEVAEKIPALLWCWYPGENGNVELAKIIFGDTNPSGHLPDTFEKRFEDAPAYGNFPGDTANGGSVNLAEGIYVGYRWYDKKSIAPAYPFGFGLSYTSFALKNLQVRGQLLGDARRYSAMVDVTNTGSRDGAEVVQLYVRPKNAADRPVQELKAFQRVELKAGEKRSVTLTFSSADFATFDEKTTAWVVPPGEYELAVGTSSRDIAQTVAVTLP